MADANAAQAVPETKETKLAEYNLNANGLPVHVEVIRDREFVPIYEITFPNISEATKLVIYSMRDEMLRLVPIDATQVHDPKYVEQLTRRMIAAGDVLIDKYLPGTKGEVKEILIAYIRNMLLGLGDLEAPLADEHLEEVAVNGPEDRIWVFHKTLGWCKTNISPQNNDAIYNQSEMIGRRIGREITNLAPLMDAELNDGSRVNATLFPISQGGNTITIRKFERNPWTMTALIKNKTITPEVAALVWLCIQNEISILITGGTASGKTSFLNALSIFFPASRRIVSVEETRELTLPKFFQWIPMLTRNPNPEGKGAVTLYDLMVNSLRQRPDIIIVGEIRTSKDAETLFEAMHTGHAVYGTLHADNVHNTIVRMTNPPIDTPKMMLNAIGGIVTVFRHRTKNIRRVLEFGEVLQSGDGSVVYKLNTRTDSVDHIGDITRLGESISLYSGMNRAEIEADIKEKSDILNWMVRKDIVAVDDAGFVVANYYKSKPAVVDAAKRDLPYSQSMFG